MPNIDERLLAGNTLAPEQEGEAARQLRERKRGGVDEEEADEHEAGEPRSFRQKVKAAKDALNLKERAKEKVEEKVTAPVKLATSRALQWAWWTLIPSWGLSLIYINIHVFLKSVFGEKLFCKLGEEWLPKPATDAAGEAGKAVNKGLGLVEVMGLLVLDLLFLFVIFGALALIVMVVDFMQAGFLQKAWLIIGGLTNLSWEGIKALYNLFAS